MKVTVCELPDSLSQSDWKALSTHVKSEKSEFLLLPEMPFAPWVFSSNEVRQPEWDAFVLAHDRWMERLGELGAAMVAGTRPVRDGVGRFNEGFIWSVKGGYQAVHRKAYLPDEQDFYEGSWYEASHPEFNIVDAGDAVVGFLICTEIWFTDGARDYARKGSHLLLSPRATEWNTAQKWIAGGQAASVVAGAYGLGSNRSGHGSGVHWGSHGWIIDPDGMVLGTTSPSAPFLTRELDLSLADRAKSSYPRYIYVD